jgi:hypothetical protein
MREILHCVQIMHKRRVLYFPNYLNNLCSVSRNINKKCAFVTHEGVSTSFRTGRLERELQMLQLSATRCSCVTILWVSLVSFATLTFVLLLNMCLLLLLCYFVSDSVRILLDTPSYTVKLGNAVLYPKYKFGGLTTLQSLFRKNGVIGLQN